MKEMCKGQVITRYYRIYWSPNVKTDESSLLYARSEQVFDVEGPVVN